MTCVELERVRDWALQKLATGQEPPWAWYQYTKLRETLDAILSEWMRSRRKRRIHRKRRHVGERVSD
jgi:hypothetical protein